MTHNCELIQDLLPLYAEGLCSSVSRKAVEEHLCECEACRQLTTPLPIVTPDDLPSADRAVEKSIKKVKRRWLSSLIAAVLIVPLLLLSVNQFRGRGLCFTNLGDVFTARRFLTALEHGDWENAAKTHDFSNDYESILEALDLDVTTWSTTFIRCDLVGYDYAAHSHLDRSEDIPTTPEDLYSYLYNRTGTAMVPLALWEQLMAMDPDAFSQNGWQYWLNGELYGKISTPWGDFVVSQGRGYDTAYDYASYFDLIPAAIYQEALPDLEADALRIYTNTHEDVGWVAELTEEEFTEEMIRRYTADLRSLEDTVSFDCTGFQSAYRLWENDGWHIEFGVTISYQNQTLETDIAIGVEDGRVRIVSLSHRECADWLDELERILYPSAHSGY